MSETSDILTLREIQIVKLIASEFSNREIAKKLGISISTVESHRKRIFHKLNAKNMAGVVNKVYQMGIITVSNHE